MGEIEAGKEVLRGEAAAVPCRRMWQAALIGDTCAMTPRCMERAAVGMGTLAEGGGRAWAAALCEGGGRGDTRCR